MKTGNARMIKEINTALIMEEMRKTEEITRNELAMRTGLTPPTVLHIVGELIDLGLVRETELGESTGGRRPRLLQLNPDGGYVIGAEIDDDITSLCLADLRVGIRAKVRLPNRVLAPERVLAGVKEGIQRLIDQAGVDPGRVFGAGVVLPGLVEKVEGICVHSTRLGWHNVPVKEWLEEETGIPVLVDHVVRGIALAESTFGAATNAKDVLCVRIGRGIGAALVVDGDVYQGSNGSLGELGHMVVWPEGPRCGCGLVGCLEAIASEAALVTSYRNLRPEIGEGPLRGTDILARGETDEAAAHVLRQAGYYLGLGLANCVKLLNPELLVISGFLKGGTVMWEEMRRVIAEQVFSSQLAVLRILPGALVADAGALGGCALVLREVYSRPMELKARLRG